MLEEQTLDLEAALILDDGLPCVDVLLTNQAGHKFPSGIPPAARVEIAIHGEDEEPLFHSGVEPRNRAHPRAGRRGVGAAPRCHFRSRRRGHLRTRARRCQWRSDHPVGTGPRTPQGQPDDAAWLLQLPRGLRHHCRRRAPPCSTPTSTWMPRGRRKWTDRIQYLLPDGWDTHGSLTVECTVWYQAIPLKWVAPMLELQGDSSIDGFRVVCGIRALAGAHRGHVVHDGHRRRRRACDGGSPRMAQSHAGRGGSRGVWSAPRATMCSSTRQGAPWRRDNAPIPC